MSDAPPMCPGAGSPPKGEPAAQPSSRHALLGGGPALKGTSADGGEAKLPSPAPAAIGSSALQLHKYLDAIQQSLIRANGQDELAPLALMNPRDGLPSSLFVLTARSGLSVTQVAGLAQLFHEVVGSHDEGLTYDGLLELVSPHLRGNQQLVRHLCDSLFDQLNMLQPETDGEPTLSLDTFIRGMGLLLSPVSAARARFLHSVADISGEGLIQADEISYLIATGLIGRLDATEGERVTRKIFKGTAAGASGLSAEEFATRVSDVAGLQHCRFYQSLRRAMCIALTGGTPSAASCSLKRASRMSKSTLCRTVATGFAGLDSMLGKNAVRLLKGSLKAPVQRKVEHVVPDLMLLTLQIERVSGAPSYVRQSSEFGCAAPWRSGTRNDSQRVAFGSNVTAQACRTEAGVAGGGEARRTAPGRRGRGIPRDDGFLDALAVEHPEERLAALYSCAPLAQVQPQRAERRRRGSSQEGAGAQDDSPATNEPPGVHLSGAPSRRRSLRLPAIDAKHEDLLPMKPLSDYFLSPSRAAETKEAMEGHQADQRFLERRRTEVCVARLAAPELRSSRRTLQPQLPFGTDGAPTSFGLGLHTIVNALAGWGAAVGRPESREGSSSSTHAFLATLKEAVRAHLPTYLKSNGCEATVPSWAALQDFVLVAAHAHAVTGRKRERLHSRLAAHPALAFWGSLLSHAVLSSAGGGATEPGSVKALVSDVESSAAHHLEGQLRGSALLLNPGAGSPLDQTGASPLECALGGALPFRLPTDSLVYLILEKSIIHRDRQLLDATFMRPQAALCVEALFWWAVLHYFVADLLPSLVAAVTSILGTSFAEATKLLILAPSKAQANRVLHSMPAMLAQGVFYALKLAFPASSSRFTRAFLSRLVFDVHELLTGMQLCYESLRMLERATFKPLDTALQLTDPPVGPDDVEEGGVSRSQRPTKGGETAEGPRVDVGDLSLALQLTARSKRRHECIAEDNSLAKAAARAGEGGRLHRLKMTYDLRELSLPVRIAFGYDFPLHSRKRALDAVGAYDLPGGPLQLRECLAATVSLRSASSQSSRSISSTPPMKGEHVSTPRSRLIRGFSIVSSVLRLSGSAFMEAVDAPTTVQRLYELSTRGDRPPVRLHRLLVAARQVHQASRRPLTPGPVVSPRDREQQTPRRSQLFPLATARERPTPPVSSPGRPRRMIRFVSSTLPSAIAPHRQGI